MHRKLSGIFVMMVVATAFLAIVPSNGSAEAVVPTWDTSKEWAMGGEIDLGDFQGAVDDLTDLADSAYGIKANADISGKVGAYQVYKVSNTAGSNYELSTHVGGGVNFGFDYSVDGSVEDIDINMDGSGFFGFSVDVEGKTEFTKDQLAIDSIEIEATVAMKAEYKGDIPDIAAIENMNSEPSSIPTKSVDTWVDGSITVDVTIDFEPPMDLFNFPIEIDEIWTVESHMTVTGTVNVKVDGEGLPPELIDQLDLEGVSLPIDETEQISDEDDVWFQLECTGMKNIDWLAGSISVYDIVPVENAYNPYDTYDYYSYAAQAGGAASGNPVAFQYAPEEGFIVSQEIDPLNDADLAQGWNLGGMESIDTDMSMQPMTVDEAENSMADLQAEVLDDPRGTDLMGLLLIFAIIGVVVIVVVAVVSKRKKKNMQQPPPGYGQPAYGQQPGYGQPQQQPYQQPPQQPYPAQQQYPPPQPPQQQQQYQQPPQQQAPQQQAPQYQQQPVQQAPPQPQAPPPAPQPQPAPPPAPPQQAPKPPVQDDDEDAVF